MKKQLWAEMYKRESHDSMIQNQNQLGKDRIPSHSKSQSLKKKRSK